MSPTVERRSGEAYAFPFLQQARREGKPRQHGVTEIRGPYYSAFGPRALEDVLDLAAPYVDAVKFAGGAFTLIPRDTLQRFITLCHERDVLVSTGGFIERVLVQRPQAVLRYLETCRELGFDIIEVSSGFITLPPEDWLRLVERIQRMGLKAKPEVGIQFGAGGASAAAELEQLGTRDVEWAIALARRFLDAGAYMIMIESEGITENVRSWRTDVPARITAALGADRIMFEAADPAVFAWYLQNYGPEVNLFVDHSQILQLECLRTGIWGTAELWGRVTSFKDPERGLSSRQTSRS